MTDFERVQQALIESNATIAMREIRIMSKVANAEIARLASHHIRGLAQSRRFWNERNRKITPPEST